MAGARESPNGIAVLASSLLEKLDEDIPNFQNQLIPEFVRLRTRCLETVEELKRKIQYASMGGSGGRLAGGLAGIVGGLTVLYGVGMSLKGNSEESEKVMRTGSGLSFVGGAAAVSATLIELGLTQKYLNEVKQILKDDQESFKSILPYMKRSRTVNLLLMKLFGYSILSENGRTIALVCYKCLKIIQAGHRTVDQLIVEIQSNKQITSETEMIFLSQEVVTKVMDCMNTLKTQPELIESYHKICSLLKNNPQVFELAKFSLQMFLHFRNVMGLDIMGSLMLLAGPTAGSSGDLLVKGGIHSITIALNIVSVIFSVRDIQSKASKYSEHLDQIKEALSVELKAVTNLQSSVAIAT